MNSEIDSQEEPLQVADVGDFSLQPDAIRDLTLRLPRSSAQLDALLTRAGAERHGEALIRLMAASLAAGHSVDARHLVAATGAFEDSQQLAAVAMRCAGDVPRALFEALHDNRVAPDLEATALVVAALWYVEHDIASPTELVARARTIARGASMLATTMLALLALASITEDDGLRALLGTVEDADAQRQAGARVRNEMMADGREPLLSVWPQENARAMLAPAYTVRRAVKRIGRNEPCPCGSGKKYKRCCYGNDMARLKSSSDVVGVTVGELRKAPERHLNGERIRRLRPGELARPPPKPSSLC